MESVKTGDIILFSNNTSCGFFLRFFTSSMWNHVGLAVRVKEVNGVKEISLTEEGQLCFLEINTGIRKDVILDQEIVGAAISDANWLIGKYNLLGCRRLKDQLRKPKLKSLTESFIEKHRGAIFTQEFVTFAGVWLGIPLHGTLPRKTADGTKEQMFCSELVARYYEECILPLVENITDNNYHSDLRYIFGKESPQFASLYSPNTFTYLLSPSAQVLEESETIIYRDEGDFIVILLLPLLLALAGIIFIYMTLPRR